MAKTRPGWKLHVFMTIFLVILLSSLQVDAHSSVERLMRVASNGSMVGTEGYPRGFWPRTAPGYYDNANIFLIPPDGNVAKILQPYDKIAHPFQRTSNYTAPYNRLTAAPGDMILMQYQENGHVTLPQNQPNKTLNRGTVYIYGTPDFAGNADLLDIHYQWNPNGTGGDRKGRLLATRNFDDGHCYENSDNPIADKRRQEFNKTDEQPMGTALWCQNDVLLPTDLAVGKPYTVIWVWDWPTMDQANITDPSSSVSGAAPGQNGATVKIPELYTTITDINIVDPCDEALGEVKGPTCNKNGTSHETFVVTETDLNKAAIQNQVSNMFIVNVTALFDVTADNSSQADPGPASLSSQSPSQSPPNPVASATGGASVTATTTYSVEAVTTTTVTGTQPGRGGRVSTTTVYDSVTVTTVTFQPNSASANPAVATAPSIKFTTLSVYGTTVTQTVTGSSSSLSSLQSGPSSAPTSSGTSPAASSSTTTSSAGSQTGVDSPTGTSTPTVTGFLDDAKPTVAKRGRRAVGQWGFGRGHA